MPASLAIFEASGHQFRATPGAKIQLEKLPGEPGEKVSFNEVLLLVEKEETQIGQPFVEGARVEAKILKQDRDAKITIWKRIPKKRNSSKRGHRQFYTEIEVTKIVSAGEKKAAPAKDSSAPAAKEEGKKPAAKKAPAKTTAVKKPAAKK